MLYRWRIEFVLYRNSFFYLNTNSMTKKSRFGRYFFSAEEAVNGFFRWLTTSGDLDASFLLEAAFYNFSNKQLEDLAVRGEVKFTRDEYARLFVDRVCDLGY